MEDNTSLDIRVLKAKLIQSVERIRNEKDLRLKAENDVSVLKKKVDMLSDHIEKLMVHLKHETNIKLKSNEQKYNLEKEKESLYDMNDNLKKKIIAKDTLINELQEGNTILEDQLRIMDEKFLELRAKLDFAREIGAVKLKKAEKTAAELRLKFQIATNSSISLDKFPISSFDHNHSLSSGMMYHDNSMFLSSNNVDNQSSFLPETSSQSKVTFTKSMLNDLNDHKEPTINRVLEKIRSHEGKKKEWDEKSIRKLANKRYK